MEWFINMGLSFAPSCAMFLILCLCVYIPLQGYITDKGLRKIFVGGVLGGVVGIFLLFSTQPSITYKHTTDYDKGQDVKTIQMKQGMPVGPIIDKTIKPKYNDKSREEQFNNSIKY